MILLVRWAPVWSPEDVFLPLPEAQDRILLIEAVPVTRQTAPPAPPSIPLEALLPPEIREEPEPERSQEPTLPAPSTAQSPGPPAPPVANPAPESRGPTRGPLPVRQVQPSLPQEAARARIQAEVVLGLTVGTDGRVVRATVQERYVMAGGARERVEQLGYGLEEAARDAALRFLFRPALDQGAPVPGAYTLTLRFGAQ